MPVGVLAGQPEVHDDSAEATTLGESIGGDDEAYEQVEASVTLDRLTSILDHRTREVLRLRFHDDLLQTEIAGRIGCSQIHVSRIIRSALETISEAQAA